MIIFYKGTNNTIFATETQSDLSQTDKDKLSWLFGNAEIIHEKNMQGYFIGPRKEMITPWSTNAVEITQNMGIDGLLRIEEFIQVEEKDTEFDPMLK